MCIHGIWQDWAQSGATEEAGSHHPNGRRALMRLRPTRRRVSAEPQPLLQKPPFRLAASPPLPPALQEEEATAAATEGRRSPDADIGYQIIRQAVTWCEAGADSQNISKK